MKMGTTARRSLRKYKHTYICTYIKIIVDMYVYVFTVISSKPKCGSDTKNVKINDNDRENSNNFKDVCNQKRGIFFKLFLLNTIQTNFLTLN